MPIDDGGTTPSSPDLEQLMMRYQKADPNASAVLVELLSPQLYRFFASQMGSRADAEDMLQDAWLRIHRVRHTYRPCEPVLPWVYAIARCVRVDSYRKRHRIASRELAADVLPDHPAPRDETCDLPAFDELVADLPQSQREVLTLLTPPRQSGLSSKRPIGHMSGCAPCCNICHWPSKHVEEPRSDLPRDGWCNKFTFRNFWPSARSR